MRRRRTRAVLAALGVGAVALTAAPAHAGERRIEAEDQAIDSSGASRHRDLQERRLRAGRKVKLFLIGDYVPVEGGQGSTKSKGDWKFTGDLEPGNYFAKVDSKPGCRDDESKNEFLKN